MLGVGILTWNGLKYTKMAVESLGCLNIPFKLYIFDNGSTDGTVEYLKYLENRASFLKVHYNEKNEGMPLGWNWILNETFKDPEAKYCMVLNSDVVLTKTINSIFPFMEEYPEFAHTCAALVGDRGVTVLEDSLPEIEFIAEEYIKNLKIDPIEIGGLNSPVTVVSRICYETVGVFDLDFPWSCNDMEYHQRVEKAGLGCCVYHKAIAWHRGGVGTSKIDKNLGIEQHKLFQKKFG